MDVQISDVITALLPMARTRIMDAAQCAYEPLCRARLEDDYERTHQAALAAGEAEAAAAEALRDAEGRLLALHARLVALHEIPAADDESISPEERVRLISEDAAAERHNAEVRERITITESLLQIGTLRAEAAAAQAASRKALALLEDYEAALDEETVLDTPLGMHTPEGHTFTLLALAIMGQANVLTDAELAARERRAVERHLQTEALRTSVAMVETGGYDPHLGAEPPRQIQGLAGQP